MLASQEGLFHGVTVIMTIIVIIVIIIITSVVPHANTVGHIIYICRIKLSF